MLGSLPVQGRIGVQDKATLKKEGEGKKREKKMYSEYCRNSVAKACNRPENFFMGERWRNCLNLSP